jgi:hypothetical protein
VQGSPAAQRNAAASTDKKDATPDPNDLTQLRAPEEFLRAVIKDPYASTYRFDFDAVRGAQPIPDSATTPGGSAVPRAGYYFDLDGMVIDWYRAGDVFPNLAPGTSDGGRFFFLTDRRDATTTDLRWILLRAGWEGNVRDVPIR